MGDVEIVGLGTGRGDVIAEALLRGVEAPLDGVEVVADPDDLGDPSRPSKLCDTVGANRTVAASCST